jgi:hypothetical protein
VATLGSEQIRLDQFRLSVVQVFRSINAEILEGELTFSVSERTIAAKTKQGIVLCYWRLDADN